MAFFKFRKGGDDQTAPAAQPESVEVLRRRAKNRLIGSAILVLIGVIGFPLLVDKQPRPVAVDLPIEIPDRNKVLPLTMPEAPSPQATASQPVASTAAAPAPAPVAVAVAVPAAPAAEATPPLARPAPTPPAIKAQDKAQETTQAKTVAKATSPNKPAEKAARYVVQVGAFADNGRVRETRLKLEKLGLRNYTQVVETKEGRRIRVRAGPFASKEEAARAAEKIRKIDLPGTVLPL